ncbi:MAG: phosphatase PAP2 family protein [Clostridia bacterium]|nr:phosphatase PAP2 family protein [Clostridia bacterium]
MEFLQHIDESVLYFIQEHMTTPLLDWFFPLVTHLGDDGILWILFALLMLFSRKYRKYGVMLAIALILSTLVGNTLIKPLIARPRPCVVDPSVSLLIMRPSGFSFPSGHTLASFAATSVFFAADRRFGWGALTLSVLIAFSRLYLFVHYPSDVLAGVVLGLMCGVMAVACVSFFRHPKKAFAKR